MERTKTIELDPAIEVAGGTYAVLNLREPTLDEMDKAAQLKGLSSVAMLISLTAGVPLAVAKKLPISVAMEASKWFEGFTEPGQETGETSTPS